MTLIVRDNGDESVGLFPASFTVECPNFERDEKHEMEWFRAMAITMFSEFAHGNVTAMFDFEIEELETISTQNDTMKKFIVKHFYMPPGNDAVAHEWSETVFAENEDAAKDQMVLEKFPTDIMFGPNNENSSREFMRGCLTVYPINETT